VRELGIRLVVGAAMNDWDDVVHGCCHRMWNTQTAVDGSLAQLTDATIAIK
jgi:hypothetical protein